MIPDVDHHHTKSTSVTPGSLDGTWAAFVLAFFSFVFCYRISMREGIGHAWDRRSDDFGKHITGGTRCKMEHGFLTSRSWRICACFAEPHFGLPHPRHLECRHKPSTCPCGLPEAASGHTLRSRGPHWHGQRIWLVGGDDGRRATMAQSFATGWTSLCHRRWGFRNTFECSVWSRCLN